MDKFDNIKWFFRKNLFTFIVSIFTLLLILSNIYLYIKIFTYKPKEKEASDLDITTKEPLEEVVETYFVDIKGEVNNPGTYEVLPGTRVLEVIEKAGGLTANANTSVNNLSLKVTDEMVIIIYSNEEVLDFLHTKEEEKNLNDFCNNDILENDTCIKESNTDDINNSSLVNINTATKEELMTLPSIGEAKALDIISYREKNGNFKSIEEIKNVSGIGDSIYAKIETYITI